MKFLKAIFSGALLVAAMSFVGCDSNEPTVVEAPPETTAAEEAEYEDASYGSADDAEQN